MNKKNKEILVSALVTALLILVIVGIFTGIYWGTKGLAILFGTSTEDMVCVIVIISIILTSIGGLFSVVHFNRVHCTGEPIKKQEEDQ